jgi:cytochrome c5
MTKKLDELPIAVTVCAPRSKGTCDVNIGKCFKCQQSDPAKISVNDETQGKIAHSLGPEGGEDGDIYDLECDVCHFKYKIGIVKKENKQGDWSFHSMFGSDERTGNRFMWIGYF